MILSGKDAANELYRYLQITRRLKLAAIYIGDNPASRTYLKIKSRTLRGLGFDFELFHQPQDTSLNDVKNLISHLGQSPEYHGIIVQLPLPEKLKPHTREIIDSIVPHKDVDCLTTYNQGKFFTGESDFMPATPQGVIDLLDFYNIKVSGKNTVIIGRSNLVGKPLSMALLKRNATVTICHSQTQNLKKIIQNSEIIFSAAGQPRFLTRDFFVPGQIVVDIGINRDSQGKICGDVDFDSVSRVVEHITPVPGGVGPMTVYGLVKNLLFLSQI